MQLGGRRVNAAVLRKRAGNGGKRERGDDDGVAGGHRRYVSRGGIVHCIPIGCVGRRFVRCW